MLETRYFVRNLAFVNFKNKDLLRFVQTKAFVNVSYDVILFKQRFHVPEAMAVFNSNVASTELNNG
jgi:hypothetical protein